MDKEKKIFYLHYIIGKKRGIWYCYGLNVCVSLRPQIHMLRSESPKMMVLGGRCFRHKGGVLVDGISGI